MSANRCAPYRSTFVAVYVLALGCGSTGSVAPAPADPSPHTGGRRPIAGGAPTVSPKGGSSDGVSCEDAQAQNVEEIDMHGGGQADLTAKDFAAVLSNGAYLAPCEVPESSKIQICV